MYNEANKKLSQVVENLDSIINDLDNFNKNCYKALLINDNTNYKSSVSNIKSSIYKEKQKIVNEILNEIKRKM